MKKEFLDATFEGIFNVNSKEFDNIELRRDALFDLVKLAKTEMHPSEFVAILEGYVESRKLKINGIKFPMKNGESNFKIDLPFLTNAVGSIISHPEGKIEPQKHELEFFDRTGGVHFIISSPYSSRDIKAFDRDGNKLGFFVR